MTYHSLDQLPLTLNANDIAQVLGISRAGAYNLLHSVGFPTVCIGTRLLTPRDKFIEWLESQVTTPADKH